MRDIVRAKKRKKFKVANLSISHLPLVVASEFSSFMWMMTQERRENGKQQLTFLCRALFVWVCNVCLNAMRAA